MLKLIKLLFLLVNIFIQFENVLSHFDDRRPNILIILADDLGWGDVSFHGSKQIPTPNIDLLASSGVIMNNYYVSPLCSPSRSALLTGLNPIRTGMQVGVIAASQPYGLPLNYTTMGQHFQRLGYRTHVVGKWHQGFFRSEYLPTKRGFDSYFGYLTGHSDYFNRKAGDFFRGYDLHEMDHIANLTKYQGQYSTDMYTDRVLELIEENRYENTKKPWLIYMAQQSVHGAECGDEIQPPRRHENDYKYIQKNERRRRFAGMVAALDESVGRVFKALNDTNQLSRTIIVFSTDNGGATAGTTGYHIDNSQGSNWPLKGGKYTLWEGGVRGTAFIWSKLLPKPYLSNQLMHITDILPTLYSAAGGNTSDLGDIDGLNQWNQLKNPNNKNNYQIREHLLHNIDHTKHFWALRYRNYKLTNGTSLLGQFDNWYEAPGQQTEFPPNGICYNCTTTYQILEEYGIKFEPITVQIDCQRDKNPIIKCQSKKGMCLFDIEQDPCELTNLAEKKSDLLKTIHKKIYEHYNVQYTKPVNKPFDPHANPALHGGFWKPWLDQNPITENFL
ncbi:arylsulfatase b-like protein [Dermatophagoides farinae]|uniref:Arylsulfatase b-like protein n=1 Tax=Dermatophagoides farinae TaxID=6954 RepID=A0A9D4P9F3_DERFA|nr:arylsulfatase B-like [Dermatophagoides farinae]KAH7646288.1 arylsulfatase b-like protein [Dermatophagoides farinae]